MLSILYVVTLIGVCVAVLALIWDAVASVSRRPVWHVTRPDLSLVTTSDRRRSELPFVGHDRRQQDAEQEAEARRIA